MPRRISGPVSPRLALAMRWTGPRRSEDSTTLASSGSGCATDPDREIVVSSLTGCPHEADTRPDEHSAWIIYGGPLDALVRGPGSARSASRASDPGRQYGVRPEQLHPVRERS